MKSSRRSSQRAELLQKMQLLSEALSTETALFHQAAAAKLGLGISDTKTLSTLLQEGPMTAGEITKRLGLTTGAVTSVIDRLERGGFVSRRRDDHDRRKVIVVADGARLAESHRVFASIGKVFGDLLDGYTTAELSFLVRFYEASIALTKREVEKLA